MIEEAITPTESPAESNEALNQILEKIALAQEGNAETRRESVHKMSWASVIRKLAPPGAERPQYLERRPTGMGLDVDKKDDEGLKKQKHHFVRMTSPFQDVAAAARNETEVVEACQKMISAVFARDQFITKWPEIDSAAVREQHVFAVPKGQVSSEPVFDPFSVPLPKNSPAVCLMRDGVFDVLWDPSGAGVTDPYKQSSLLDKHPIPSVKEFLLSLKTIMSVVQDPACKAMTYRRLTFLEKKFDYHVMFNASLELQIQKDNSHRDFYNVRKVDTHIHHSAAMHQKHLLRFIRKKYYTEPNSLVAKDTDGSLLTLAKIFEKVLGISAWEASVDLLNVHALGSCFHRFDIFNTKYNPFGQAVLREVFLKTDNLIAGRFLAELSKEIMEELVESKYQFAEWRVSIYGKSKDEWRRLAIWMLNNGLTCKNVRWMIQVPRLYSMYRQRGYVKSFADLLDNIFGPVFEAIARPEDHPEIFLCLHQIVGWDSVDDESVVSKYTSEGMNLPDPENWVSEANPPYSYWGYYMYANIRALNVLLTARGLRTMPFRPHCGETGSISHLASMYLLADGINHGIMLRKSPVLMYLFYIKQIGLAVSPLSNNALFHEISRNPFHRFFKVGMNVSLSTDDPLMFHFTNEPLLEEYSVCAHVWKLNPVDLCELARNSVLQSNFEPQLKRHWLGPHYKLAGTRGNTPRCTNVPNIRVAFRAESLQDELRFLKDVVCLDESVDFDILKRLDTVDSDGGNVFPFTPQQIIVDESSASDVDVPIDI